VVIAPIGEEIVEAAAVVAAAGVVVEAGVVTMDAAEATVVTVVAGTRISRKPNS
jgi:hypothetical protein